MQRVRIGITGLAVVFLIVLLAAAIVGFHSKDIASNNGATEAGNSLEEKSGDPLAELGVAPGGTAGESSDDSAAPGR